MADLQKILRLDFWNYLTGDDLGKWADFRNQDLRVYGESIEGAPIVTGRAYSVVGSYWKADSYFIQVVPKLIYTNRRS